MADIVTVDERMRRIRELLGEADSLSVSELAKALSVSEMTVRRDVAELERAGFVQRTHGAVLATERLSFEMNFAQRRRTRREQKLAIAAAAARLVDAGSRVFVDAGTTTLEFVHCIRDVPNLVVVTTSLAVAAALQYAESVETILLGGRLQHGRPDLGGGFTEDMLELFSADFAFQGADGIDLEGYVYNANVDSARVSQKMRQRAQRSYILSDSSKIGQTALFRFGNLRDGCGLITDSGIEPQHLHAFRELHGIDVKIASASPSGENTKEEAGGEKAVAEGQWS